MTAKAKNTITTSSTAEYFAKNLQQVGFSSPTKAVLTTLKEAVDNALDACEDHGILPDVTVEVEKLGPGTLKNTDRIRVKVVDNGPGIEPDDVPKVFGEYLASSKFGRGRCSRGQQGIGISAATTWAQLTTATGARVITKTERQRKAVSMTVEVDIKRNQGSVKDKQTLESWDREHGTSVEFIFDGRIQINGEAGLMNYLTGNILVNPHMTLHYKLPEMEQMVTVERVTQELPRIPEATEPHPHTMKLGEFIAHSHLFGRSRVDNWLRTGFSRVGPAVLEELKKKGVPAALFGKSLESAGDEDIKRLFTTLQETQLLAPSTQSVLSIGEEGLAKSVQRIGEVDFFSVVSRKPAICDFKPVQVEVAIARLKERTNEGDDEPVQVLRFANRVPLQFDKAACAIVNACTTVNWRAYGLNQPKRSLPTGPYVVAVSVVSPFIKFKNASKETIDSSDELVEEIRRALIQAGQRLSRHIRAEDKAAELEKRIAHIEQFGPILVEGLCNITGAPAARKKRAEDGLRKILGRDAEAAEAELAEAQDKLDAHVADAAKRGVQHVQKDVSVPEEVIDMHAEHEAADEEVAAKPKKGGGPKGKKLPPAEVPA